MVIESMTSMNHKPQPILLPSCKTGLSLLKPCGYEVEETRKVLKADSHLPKKFFLFASMKVI